MINDIKMGFKVLKYGLNFKTNIVFAIMFMILGVLLDMNDSTFIAAFYIPLVGIYFGQIAHSIVQSTMVQTSSNKKKMQTKIPVVIMGSIMLLYNTVVVTSRMLMLYWRPESKAVYAESMLWGGLMTLVIMLYFAFAMKFYWPATICFFVVFYALFMGAMFSTTATAILESSNFTIMLEFARVDVGVSVGIAIAFSYVCILLGSAINYGISVLLYNKDYSKMNFQKALERAK